MRLVPAAEIDSGFFRTCASVYLLVRSPSSPDLNRRLLELLRLSLLPLFLMYFASLWLEKLPARSRLLEITSVISFCAIIASSLSDSAAGVSAKPSPGT